MIDCLNYSNVLLCLIDRLQKLPEKEQVFCERILENSIEIAEKRIEKEKKRKHGCK